MTVTNESQFEADPGGQPGGMQDIGRAVQGLGIGEQLAIFGSVGVLASWLVFHLLMAEYSIAHLPFLLAAFTVFLGYRFHIQQAMDWPVPYRTLLIVLAALVGLIGARDLVIDLRYEIFDADAPTIIGAMVYWATAIATGVGAIRMASK